MKLSRAVWAEINLNNLANNIQEVRRVTNKNAKVTAVIKADGYGHSAVDIGETLLKNGADRFAVATLSEAILLRKDFKDTEIMVLGYTPESLAKEVIENNIIQTIYSKEQAKIFAKVALDLEKEIIIHIKIDTGMHRLGLLPTDETVEEVFEIGKLNGLKIEGIFTHFATADEIDKEYTKTQVKKFNYITEQLEKKGLTIPIKHVSNSAAIIDLPEFNFDMVRAGIMTYGLYPSNNVNRDVVDLKEVMCLKAKISQIKELSLGDGVSYGLKYTFHKAGKIAILPIGYADGYTRLLSNKSHVMINGIKAPIIGNICMDQCIVDITEIDAEVGDEVVLFGGNDPDGISIDSIANILNTINYEVVCMVDKRVPRVFIQNNKTIKVKDYLLD
jgi:alanine racemase